MRVRVLVRVLFQKRDVSAEEKDKFPYDIVKMALPPEAQLAADAEVRAEPALATPPSRTPHHPVRGKGSCFDRGGWFVTAEGKNHGVGFMSMTS